MLEWINVFKVNRKIKSRLWPWIKIILSIVLFFVVFYSDIYVHILDGTNLGRIVEAMILVVFISYALLYFAFELIHEDDLTKLNTRMYIYFMINGILLLWSWVLPQVRLSMKPAPASTASSICPETCGKSE